MNAEGSASVMSHVGILVTDALCRGCGTCVGVCPSHALSLEATDTGFSISCDEDACVRCGLCAKVCPALEPPKIAEPGSGRPEALIGGSIATYMGFAADETVREVATSGGVATALLVHALENDLIDAAVVNRMNRSNTRCESFIARDRREVLEASGTKYCPSTTNEALAEVVPGPDRVAVVGLPCQMTGAANAANASARFEQIKLRIGIFCSHGVTKAGLPFLLDKHASGSEKLRRVSYRAEGWPGSLLVEYASGERVTISHDVHWRNLFGPGFFTPSGCLQCGDLASEDADISLADAWLPEVRARDAKGTSLILVRTERGREMMDRLLSEGQVVAARIDPEEVVRAQAGVLRRKKRGLPARLRLAPNSGGDALPKANVPARVSAAIMQMNARMSSRPWGRRLLRRLPAGVLRRYASFVYALASRSR